MIWYNKCLDFKKIVPQRPNLVCIKNRGKNAKRYLELYCGFDIETTTLENHHAYMYCWQFSINSIVIMGRHWSEFLDLLQTLQKIYTLRETTRIIIWVANLGFEFQFMRKLLNISHLFAKHKREPLYFIHDKCIEFRECLSISGGNLAQLAKDYCRTPKLVGDLDYSKERSFKTPLDEKEISYCCNDVIILSEWSEYIFNEYIKPLKYVPLTKTGILRKDIKQGVTDEIKSLVLACFPPENLYNYWMKYLFRGGYVHSNRAHTNKVLSHVYGADITSSYPDRMNNGYFPNSPFIEADISNWQSYLDTHCCILDITFTNLKNLTSHSIESSNKAIELENPIIDNGRILFAEKVRVLLTELDYDIYTKYYTWTNIEVHSIHIAKRGKLPRYLLKVLNSNYQEKDELKKDGFKDTPIYVLKKGKVNSAYGVCVTKMHPAEIVYEGDEWSETTSKFNYQKEIKKQFLLPQWGIWISSHARHKLLTMVYKFHKDVIYCDTDSIYFKNKENLKYIEDYNNQQKEIMRQYCNTHNLPFEHFNDLGCFDLELDGAERFKTLGAKRYVYEKDGKPKVTVAGLPKKALVNYCKEHKIDIFDYFTNRMLLDQEVSLKNTSKYNDEPHSDIVDGVRMYAESSCGIYKIPFQLNLAEAYLTLLTILKKEELQNGRIY